MKTDYKFAYILRKDDVHIDECGVRFYEGDITTEDEKDFNGNIIPVTTYRRFNKIKEVVFTEKDFGVISSDDELRVFLNGKLRKDKTRVPVDEQNTLDIKKVK